MYETMVNTMTQEEPDVPPEEVEKNPTEVVFVPSYKPAINTSSCKINLFKIVTSTRVF